MSSTPGALWPSTLQLQSAQPLRVNCSAASGAAPRPSGLVGEEDGELDWDASPNPVPTKRRTQKKHVLECFRIYGFLFLVVWPRATSSVLAPRRDALCY